MTIEQFSKKAKQELERRRSVREAMFKHSGFLIHKSRASYSREGRTKK